MRIIWAIGAKKPTTADALHYHGHGAERRGVKSLSLLVYESDIPDEHDKDTFKMDLLMNDVSDTTTANYCANT